jgi:hypothetical protein
MSSAKVATSLAHEAALRVADDLELSACRALRYASKLEFPLGKDPRSRLRVLQEGR